MKNKRLKISISVWLKLVNELRKRGQNQRESGAFLLGDLEQNQITSFICYDDLDPHSIEKGYINFAGDGYIPLWDHCNKYGLCVLADVHTHPRKWTGQSDLDKTHPMIATIGHIALIIPFFAKKRFQFLKGVGIHEYLGNHLWKHWNSSSNKFKISIL